MRVFSSYKGETNSHFRGLGKRFLHEPENGVTGNGWCNAEEILFVKKNEVFFPNAHFGGEVLKKCGEVKTRFLRNSFPVLLSDSRKNHQVQNSTLAYSTRVPAHSKIILNGKRARGTNSLF